MSRRSVRILILVLALSITLVALAGCGSTSGTGQGTQKSDQTVALSESDTGSNQPSDNKIYEFKFSHHDPAGGVKDKFFNDWAKAVADATDGRVKITVYPVATLGATPDGLNMVRTGVCDILWSFTGFFGKEFQATQVLSLPLLGIKTAQESVDIYWDLYESMPDVQKEFQGLKVLALYTHPGAVIATKNKLIDTVDDLKGLRMRVPSGPPTDVFQEWGCNTVSIPSNELYEAVEKNVVHGYSFDWGGIPDFKLHEPVKYFCDIRLYVGPMFIVWNEKSWNSLPPDLQQKIEALIGRDFSKQFATTQDKVVEEFIPQVQSMGKTVVVPTAEAMEGFKVGAKKVHEKWVQAMNSSGYDGTGLYNKVTELVTKYLGQ